MSRTQEITVPALHLKTILEFFAQFEGDRPIMLAYRINRILEPVGEMYQQFLERMAPYIDEQGYVQAWEENEEGERVRRPWTDEERAAMEEILNETITLRVVPVSLQEMDEAGLTVPNEQAIGFLMHHGLVTA